MMRDRTNSSTDLCMLWAIILSLNPQLQYSLGFMYDLESILHHKEVKPLKHKYQYYCTRDDKI